MENDNDYIRISSEELQVRDTDGEVIITFAAVDISGGTGDVIISFGDLDFNIRSSSSNWTIGDYIDILYSFDNGASFTRIPNHMGLGDMDHTFITPDGLVDGEDFNTSFTSDPIDPGTATSIILQLKASNSGSNEEFEFDDFDISRGGVSQWSEDFSGYTDPSGIGGGNFQNSGDYPSGVTKWTITLDDDRQLENPGDYIWVEDESGNKVLEYNDLGDNDPVFFDTSVIDITGEANVTFGFDINFRETTYEVDDFVDVFYSIDGGATYNLVQDDGNGHTYSGTTIGGFGVNEDQMFVETLTGLSSTNFILRIVASNDSSNEDYQLDNIQVVAGTTLSTSSNEFANAVNMYPNPVTNNELHIKLLEGTNSAIEFYDLAGRKVLNAKIQNRSVTTLNLNSLNKGLYLVKLNQGSKSITKKVIIQ